MVKQLGFLVTGLTICFRGLYSLYRYDALCPLTLEPGEEKCFKKNIVREKKIRYLSGFQTKYLICQQPEKSKGGDWRYSVSTLIVSFGFTIQTTRKIGGGINKFQKALPFVSSIVCFFLQRFIELICFSCSSTQCNESKCKYSLVLIHTHTHILYLQTGRLMSSCRYSADLQMCPMRH